MILAQNMQLVRMFIKHMSSGPKYSLCKFRNLRIVYISILGKVFLRHQIIR